MGLVLLAQLVPTLSFPSPSLHLAFLDQSDFPHLAMRRSSAVRLLARHSDWPQPYPFNQHLFGTDWLMTKHPGSGVSPAQFVSTTLFYSVSPWLVILPFGQQNPSLDRGSAIYFASTTFVPLASLWYRFTGQILGKMVMHREKINGQVAGLKPAASEANVMRNYLDWLTQV